MDRWSDRILESLEGQNIEVHIFYKYVDDVNLAVDIIPKGWVWITRTDTEGMTNYHLF